MKSPAGKDASAPWPLCLLFLGFATMPASAGTFSEIKDFGTNYSKATMWLHVPAKLAAKPAVLVYPHACGGTAYPGYTGPRPRMQLWHGTEYATLVFANFAEEIKQWTSVLGVSETPTATMQNSPKSGWIRTQYANPNTKEVMVEAIQETNQPHNPQILQDSAVKFFGLHLPASTSLAASPRQEPAFQAVRNGGTGAWKIAIDSPPGRVSLDSFDLGGKRMHRIADRFSATGRSFSALST